MEKEMIFKYTTDGKKVVIIGNLNSQEKIVQEVFIVNGNEVPSGENFVVKSLHDAPAVSWKETNIKNLDEVYNKASKAHELRMNELNGKLRTQRELLLDKLVSVGYILKNVSEDSFKMIVDYLLGNIKYIVTEGWIPELIDFDKVDEACSYDRNKMALVSIFGKDDGTLTFGIGSYSDGSGGREKVKFTAYNNYDDALQKFKTDLLATPLSDNVIAKCKEYGFDIDADKLAAYKEEKRKSYNASIESYTKHVDSFKNALSELENL